MKITGETKIYETMTSSVYLNHCFPHIRQEILLNQAIKNRVKTMLNEIKTIRMACTSNFEDLHLIKEQQMLESILLGDLK